MPSTFMTSGCVLLTMRNASDRICKENQNSRLMRRFRDNVEKLGTARKASEDNIIRGMRFHAG